MLVFFLLFDPYNTRVIQMRAAALLSKARALVSGLSKESTPKGRVLDPPPEGAHEDCQSSQSYSGGME
jgi:hypothetical protein